MFCKIGSVNPPEDRMNINYGANSYSFAYKEIVNFNRNYNGLLDSIRHRKLKSNYRIYILETRYQRDHIGAQAIQLYFKFARGVAHIICHALVSARRIIRIHSDGSKMIDIVL